MKIARVFPRRTTMTPTDKDAYIGLPTLFMPYYDEAHISVTFTWDMKRAEELMKEWAPYAKRTMLGGPAMNSKGMEFVAGKYLKNGITITSRGCPNNCPFCFVPKREGQIRELPIVSGNIVQDNNLLACSKSHLRKVFAMLRKERQVDFPGGLEAGRITDAIVDDLRTLRIRQLWLAYDVPEQEKSLVRAVQRLKKYFKRDKLRCYVLIGYKGDTIEAAEGRLRRAFEIGTLPFAMRYRTPDSKWQGTYLFKERAWNLLARQWTRPAIIKSRMKYVS